MTITVTWGNDARTALLWTFDGQWTWADYPDAVRVANALTRDMQGSVDLIIDLRNSRLPQPGPVGTGRDTAPTWRANFVALVGANAMPTRTTLAILTRFGRDLRDHIIYASSVEEARALLADETETVA